MSACHDLRVIGLLRSPNWRLLNFRNRSIRHRGNSSRVKHALRALSKSYKNFKIKIYGAALPRMVRRIVLKPCNNCRCTLPRMPTAPRSLASIAKNDRRKEKTP